MITFYRLIAYPWTLSWTLQNILLLLSESEWDFIPKYVYAHKELISVIEETFSEQKQQLQKTVLTIILLLIICFI